MFNLHCHCPGAAYCNLHQTVSHATIGSALLFQSLSQWCIFKKNLAIDIDHVQLLRFSPLFPRFATPQAPGSSTTELLHESLFFCNSIFNYYNRSTFDPTAGGHVSPPHGPPPLLCHRPMIK